MQFLSWPGFLLGGAALAAGLFFLQRLRVRHRPLKVVTTLFWREAIDASRARVLMQRFRHPWAYAFILGLCLLMWFVFSEPRASDDHGPQYLLIWDGSADMAQGDDFDRAYRAVAEQIKALPQDRRRVLWVGDRTRTLLAPGEESSLFAERAKGLLVARSPSRVMECLADALAVEADARPVCLVASSVALNPARLDLLPPGSSIHAIMSRNDSPSRGLGITTIGLSPAQSGAFDRVDVYLEVRGDIAADRGISDLKLWLDGQPLTYVQEQGQQGDRAWIYLRDVLARGQLLEATLGDVGYPARKGSSDPRGSRARLRLPQRTRIKVAVSAKLPAALRLVLETDTALDVVVVAAGKSASLNADVVVRIAGESLALDLPFFELSPADRQTEAILVQHDGDLDSQQALLSSFTALGLDQIDASELATSMGRSIEVGARPGDRRGLSMWWELISDEYDFRESRGFPLFVAKSMRWLAKIEAFPARVAAGEAPLLAQGVAESKGLAAFRDDNGEILVAAGTTFLPPAAGDYRSLNAAELGEDQISRLSDSPPGPNDLSVSLFAPSSLAPVGDSAALGADFDAPGASGNLLTWLLFLILGLLLLEWSLYSLGRIP